LQISSAILLKINHDFPEKILVGKTGDGLQDAVNKIVELAIG
jgi:hypothetical protein